MGSNPIVETIFEAPVAYCNFLFIIWRQIKLFFHPLTISKLFQTVGQVFFTFFFFFFFFILFYLSFLLDLFSRFKNCFSLLKCQSRLLNIKELIRVRSWKVVWFKNVIFRISLFFLIRKRLQKWNQWRVYLLKHKFQNNKLFLTLF